MRYPPLNYKCHLQMPKYLSDIKKLGSWVLLESSLCLKSRFWLRTAFPCLLFCQKRLFSINRTQWKLPKITTEKAIFINVAFHLKLFSDSDAAQLFKLNWPNIFKICEILIPRYWEWPNFDFGGQVSAKALHRRAWHHIISRSASSHYIASLDNFGRDL
jgi:hypothetical protein